MLAMLPGPTVTMEENNLLIGHVTEAEIKDAIWSLPSGKAPGIDGFSASFFKAYCLIIKKEVIEAVQLFLQTSTMRKKLLSSSSPSLARQIPLLSSDLSAYAPLCTKFAPKCLLVVCKG